MQVFLLISRNHSVHNVTYGSSNFSSGRMAERFHVTWNIGDYSFRWIHEPKTSRLWGHENFCPGNFHQTKSGPFFVPALERRVIHLAGIQFQSGKSKKASVVSPARRRRSHCCRLKWRTRKYFFIRRQRIFLPKNCRQEPKSLLGVK